MQCRFLARNDLNTKSSHVAVISCCYLKIVIPLTTNLYNIISTLDGFYDKISKLFKAQTRILTIEINIKLLQHDIGEVI